jgi:hypothetical protein
MKLSSPWPQKSISINIRHRRIVLDICKYFYPISIGFESERPTKEDMPND